MDAGCAESGGKRTPDSAFSTQIVTCSSAFAPQRRPSNSVPELQSSALFIPMQHPMHVSSRIFGLRWPIPATLRSLRWFSADVPSRSAFGLQELDPIFKPYSPGVGRLEKTRLQRQVTIRSLVDSRYSSSKDSSKIPPDETPSKENNEATLRMNDEAPSKVNAERKPLLTLGFQENWKKSRAAPGNRLSSRHVLVTGGASGIGYAVAKRCIEEGASSVAILSRSATRAQEAIEKIKQETGLSDAPVWAVIGDLEQHEDLAIRLLELKFNEWNTLVNCAGETQDRFFQGMNPAVMSRLLRVNLEAPMALSKVFMRLWKRRRLNDKKIKHKESGSQDTALATERSFCIVNVSSLLAIKGGEGASVYATSKAGLLGFTRSQALELATYRDLFEGDTPPMRINAILPGYIDTPMTEGFKPLFRDKLESLIPLHRFGTPEEVADGVIFLVGNEYANNCMLNLDGGLSAS